MNNNPKWVAENSWIFNQTSLYVEFCGIREEFLNTYVTVLRKFSN